MDRAQAVGMIAKKPLAATPKRLPQLRIRFMQYDLAQRCTLLTLFQWHTCHSNTPPAKADQEVERVHSVNFLSVFEAQLQENCEETAKDPVLQSLKAVILNGWPSRRERLPSEFQPYFNIRDELATQSASSL